MRQFSFENSRNSLDVLLKFSILDRLDYQTNDIKWLAQRKDWVGLSSISMMKTTILRDDGTQSEEKRCCITSLSSNVDEFAYAVRGHWAVESMYWHLDVTFREDKNHTLNKISAENMNIIRKWALSCTASD